MYVKRKDLLLIASGYNEFIVLIFACCVTAKLFPVLSEVWGEVTLAEHASKQNTAPSVLLIQFMVSYKQSIHLGNLPQQLQFIDVWTFPPH